MATLTSTLQTEANAGEYDVPQCAPGTPAHLCVHEITAHFKVSDMMQVRRKIYCKESETCYTSCKYTYSTLSFKILNGSLLSVQK